MGADYIILSNTDILREETFVRRLFDCKSSFIDGIKWLLSLYHVHVFANLLNDIRNFHIKIDCLMKSMSSCRAFYCIRTLDFVGT